MGKCLVLSCFGGWNEPYRSPKPKVLITIMKDGLWIRGPVILSQVSSTGKRSNVPRHRTFRTEIRIRTFSVPNLRKSERFRYGQRIDSDAVSAVTYPFI